MNLRRMWINQPSAGQTFHKDHGKNVLALRITDKWAWVWFTSGPIISQKMSWSALSDGWKNNV